MGLQYEMATGSRKSTFSAEKQLLIINFTLIIHTAVRTNGSHNVEAGNDESQKSIQKLMQNFLNMNIQKCNSKLLVKQYWSR